MSLRASADESRRREVSSPNDQTSMCRLQDGGGEVSYTSINVETCFIVITFCRYGSSSRKGSLSLDGSYSTSGMALATAPVCCSTLRCSWRPFSLAWLVLAD